MSCPHALRGDSSTCSLCQQAAGSLGVPVRRVSALGPDLLVDGQPAGRALNLEADSASLYYGKRGKAASVRVTRGRK